MAWSFWTVSAPRSIPAMTTTTSRKGRLSSIWFNHSVILKLNDGFTLPRCKSYEGITSLFLGFPTFAFPTVPGYKPAPKAAIGLYYGETFHSSPRCLTWIHSQISNSQPDTKPNACIICWHRTNRNWHLAEHG